MQFPIQTEESAVKSIKRILCPVDVYDFQPEAMEYAQTLAKALEAQIAVVYVMEPLPIRYMGDGYSVLLKDYEKHEKEAKQKAEEKLSEIISECFCSQIDKCAVVLGHASDKVLQLAEEYSGDMIVMASHGRSFWGRAIHGSVTNKVLANTKIPVLVIYPKKEQ